MDDEAFLHVQYAVEAHPKPKSWTEQDLEDSLELVESLAGDGPVYMVADIRWIPRPTPKARDVKPEDSASVVALLVGNAVTRMLAYYYVGLTRPAHTTRVFTCEDKAVAWLRSVRDERKRAPDG
jgi:hypothetical protein